MASEAASTIADAASDGDWMRSIAGQIQYLSTGDRAALRRMELTRSPAASGVVIKLLMRAQVPASRQRDDFVRWRLMAHVAAMLSGTAALPAHAEGRAFGSALAEADISENRVLRLLATRGDALYDQVRRAARVLSNGRKPVNLWAIYHLVGDHAGKAEAARLRIAQDYYAAKARSDKGDDE